MPGHPRRNIFRPYGPACPPWASVRQAFSLFSVGARTRCPAAWKPPLLQQENYLFLLV